MMAKRYSLEEKERAEGALERLSDAYVADAEAVHEQTMHANQRATYIAIGVAALLVLGIGGLLVWLRHAVFRPVFGLERVVRRLGAGEREVRAPEDGVADIRRIAQLFNEMASALERRRENRIALLGGIVHDLRNPLSVLKVSTRVIAPDRPLPPDERIRKTRRLDLRGRIDEAEDRVEDGGGQCAHRSSQKPYEKSPPGAVRPPAFGTPR